MNKARPRKPSSRRFPVNSYPMVRQFTTIGTGDDEFVQSMAVVVEFVIQESIPNVCVYCSGKTIMVTQKVSSMGKYVSVNIGPIHVVLSEQLSFPVLSHDRNKTRARDSSFQGCFREALLHHPLFHDFDSHAPFRNSPPGHGPLIACHL
ncbi:hypothetical protein OPV22_019531 [Ensete ventricosum]|uniref:Uncharacterized protein n=1 Tax=Ensete ventricosum TaxID=4639 RepID=A0AAV8Q7V1_ENSVE|nr:hypothetical protein OPV22_019531 [Ensete ventricosum]